MPVHKLVKSLESLCVAKVVDNLEIVARQKFMGQVEPKCEEQLLCPSPFDLIPSPILATIFDTATSVWPRMKIENLSLLIRKQLRVMKLIFCCPTDVEIAIDLLHLAAVKQLELEKLSLQRCNIPVKKFHDFLPALFPGLIKLNFSGGITVDDSLLCLIGEHCRNLKLLNLGYCSKISDAGIRRLCVVCEDSGDRKDIGGHCKSIVHLDIRATKVTVLGARLAIENLPKLEYLRCSHSLKVVFEMSHSSGAPHSHDDPPLHHHPADGILRYRGVGLPLVYLPYEEFPYPYVRGELAAALQFCPFVTIVDIFEAPGVFDDELRALENLQNLRRLALGQMDFSFARGLLPILEKLGSKSLEDVELMFLSEVNVAAIAQHCPKLRSLHLDGIEQYIQSTSTQSKLLHQLQSLEKLWITHNSSQTNGAPTSTDLSILLSSPSLVLITMSGLDALTDQLIERAVFFHQCFSKLDWLVIYCANITTRSIDLLLNSTSPITKLEFHGNENLREEIAIKWKKLVLDNNWDLFIKWNDRTVVGTQSFR